MPIAAPKDLALYAIEVCTAIPLAHFQALPVGEVGTFGDLGPVASPLFAMTKDEVIRQIARTAREDYPDLTSPAGTSAAARLIVDAITDLRDDDRLSVIAENATPDGPEAAALSERLLGHRIDGDGDAFEALLPLVMKAASELLDGIELHLASRTDRP
jgi:hypothetical protein